MFCYRIDTYRSDHQQTGHCSEGSGKCSEGQLSEKKKFLFWDDLIQIENCKKLTKQKNDKA